MRGPQRLRHNERAASAAEYALIVCLLAVIALSILARTGEPPRAELGAIAGQID
ncbi:Flp pilus assembly pilin Flp [Rhodoblastus acidophilus]|uniref:hypothetical protein n=1 Tax=Rhodoblastus acidophilus TaxID=1074 RepID=UPI00160B4196|nr:hypothetical protein [Rhodoblastus acidophilus]MCW2286401.1 Flp pilus assembly pilin Flp [Rhodoblastus acidophilus]MCW2335250.1 Flp pilus assembly pilin Flp [Rhodoblastus acidophilus]